MRRLLLLLLTVLGCWLGSGPAGLTYAEPASPVSTYTYDVPADLSMVAEVTANRGPPSSTYGYGTYDAVDRWSHGAQARPETTLSPSTTTHAHTGVLTQAVRATTTTGAQVGSTHGDFSSLHRSGVAAKSEGAWFQVTKAGANRAGTYVPESFDLSVAGENFSVVPNATKHMAEYARSTGAGSMPMSSFAGAVETAVKQGLGPGRNFIQIGPWELGIDTADNVIYHAVYRP